MRFLTLSLSMLLCTPAFAAHKLAQKTTIIMPPGVPPQPEQNSVILWDGARMRTDSGAEQSSIIDYKNDTLIILNNSRKEYSESKISEMIKSVKETLDAMKKQMAAMPPEQRAAMAEMFKPKGELKLEKTDESTKISGFHAKKFLLKQNGKALGEVWYTRAIDMSDIAPYAKKFAEMTKGMMGASWADVLAKVENGYPVRSVIVLEMMGQKASYTTETLSYEKSTSDASKFAAPADFKKVAAPKLPGMPSAPH